MDNIRDFILPTTRDNPSEEPPALPRKPVDVDYSVVFASGPDFAVRRKTKMSSKVLVFLVSQNQYYIKDERKGSIEDMTSVGYARFMSDCAETISLEESTGTKCSWLTGIERGKYFGEDLAKMAKMFKRDADFRSAALHNWLLFEPHDLVTVQGYEMKRNVAADETVIRKVLSVCEEYRPEFEVKRAFSELATKGLRSHSKTASAIYALLEKISFGYQPPASAAELPRSLAEILLEEYGLSGIEDMLREYFSVAIESFPTYRYFFDLFHICELNSRMYTVPKLQSGEKRRFKLKELNHYLWYQSVYQGFADNMDNFMTSWIDSLRMQELIYGKITEKYPAHLASCEKKLSFKYNQLKMKVDEARWNETVESMKTLEYKGKTFSMICPKTPTDVVDEAQQQSNCVASYVRSIIDGSCMIFFCRYTKTPEKSLVTVELRSDGTLGQVKARFNRAPSAEAQDFVEKWYNDVVLKSELWLQAAA